MGPVSVDNICSLVQTDILVAAKNNFRQTKGLVNYKFSSNWWMEKCEIAIMVVMYQSESRISF